jgi:murein DD-endopeptidase MepM/ murein hydrolase activator NlpD/Zn-dependent protease with chaperone function
MNTLMIERLGFWSMRLLQFLLEQTFFSALIFLVVLLLSFVLHRRSPLLLLGIWTLVFVRLILPPSFTLPTSLHPLWKNTAAPWIQLPGSSTGMAIETSALSPVAAAQTGKLPVYVPIVTLMLWMGGMLLLLMHQAARLRDHNRLLQRAQPVQEPRIIKQLQVWQRHLQLKKSYRLVSIDSCQGPFISGFFRPTIFIPRQLLQVNDSAMIECVLAHELAHIKRRDYILLPLQALLQVVFFFNPIIWITASRVNLLRECACDSLVLEKRILAPHAYASGLLRALKYAAASPNPLAAQAALGHPSQKFKYRIKQMKGNHTMSPFIRCARFLFLLVLSLTVLPMAQDHRPDHVNPADTMQTGQSNLSLVNPLSIIKVTLGFGPARHPYTGEEWLHQGIDLAARREADVYACAAGTVIEAVSEYTINKGAGRYVTLLHAAGYASRYTHLYSLSVKTGDVVKAGEVIGKVGTTGLSTGPHLHFELWRNDKPVNPLPYLHVSEK